MSTDPGTRSFFLDDFSDEVVPCEATLEGWANWLAQPDLDSFVWQEEEYPIDGSTYDGSAILWSEDIVARVHRGQWQLSRAPEPGEDFLAVRWNEGAGWSPDEIIFAEDHQAAAVAIIEHLTEFHDDPDDDDVEYIACGRNENGWRFTFHAGPPAQVIAERVQ